MKKLPFDVTILDTEPVYVTNPFSGDGVMLSPEEVAIYDVLKGAEMLGQYDYVRKGLDWFMENNAEAYMVLLD